MVHNIIPLSVPRDQMTYLGAVQWALSRMEPEAWSPTPLPGEDEMDAAARLAAAGDVLDDLLAEFAATTAERQAEILARLAAEYADLLYVGDLLAELRADLEGAA